ncbi:phage tail tube protein [Subtercola vilae]|uniref:IPT/TIG domain-containing protein n=1 Tax=Subtercola vilae TaxID=2056433 RepID=A0A4T2BVN7_9MICO|nr:IPT/TIG domain-containing protein [Subtercola vilae]TIH33678.1 hypothetical protein D4765_14440 [Subtercola vilae]
MSVALARRFRVDISTDNTTWVKYGGITDFASTENPTTQAADTYDTNGFNGFEKTMTGWQNVVKALMPTTAGIPSDPGQLLADQTRFQFGSLARLYTRWYDRNGGLDAWTGIALVDWNQSKTGVADIDEVTVTFKGDGALTRISNPFNAPVVPVVTSASPSGAAAGAQVTIGGSGFLTTMATTGVKFGGVNASSWVIISDSVLVAIMPTGSAGSAPVTVTNGIGTSNALAYTRS